MARVGYLWSRNDPLMTLDKFGNLFQVVRMIGMGTMRNISVRLALVLLLFGGLPASSLESPAVIMTSAGEDGGIVRSFRMRFSAPMVPLGDPRAPAPVDVACPVSGTGRWIDGQNFIHEFSQALPGGLT